MALRLLIAAITQNFLFASRLDFDKTARNEMCSSGDGRLPCLRFASVRSPATALSRKSGAAIWR